MRTRKLAAFAAVLAPLALAAPAAHASDVPTLPLPAAAAAPPAYATFTFIPPKVAPIQVIIGATYIGGKLISPGVNVATPGTSLPPMTWTLPLS
ncbi:MAG TPA: hypothetical protein VI318_06700 [Baekduia sp.]